MDNYFQERDIKKNYTIISTLHIRVVGVHLLFLKSDGHMYHSCHLYINIEFSFISAEPRFLQQDARSVNSTSIFMLAMSDSLQDGNILGNRDSTIELFCCRYVPFFNLS